MRYPHHSRPPLKRAFSIPIRSPNRQYWWGFGGPRPRQVQTLWQDKNYPKLVSKLHNKWQQFRVGKLSERYMLKLWSTYTDMPFFDLLVALAHARKPKTRWNEVFGLLHVHLRLWEPSSYGTTFLYQALERSVNERFDAAVD
jgi:hypothetical protein